MRCGIFLDRDNTLIANDGDLGDPSGVVLLPGAAWGVRALREAGYAIAVVSNQGGVARGKYSVGAVELVNAETERQLRHAAAWTSAASLVESWRYCPFHPDGSVSEFRREHPWRKPAPGMLIDAAQSLSVDLTRSWMVGDQERDVEAGRAAGCRTILIARANTDAEQAARSAADFVETDLLHAARRILRADGHDGAMRWAATSAARLVARTGALGDTRTADEIQHAAREIASSQGVVLVRSEVDLNGVLVEVVGEEMLALGLAAELRRTTNAARERRGESPLWTSP